MWFCHFYLLIDWFIDFSKGVRLCFMYACMCILQFDVLLFAFVLQQRSIHILMKDNNKKEPRLFIGCFWRGLIKAGWVKLQSLCLKDLIPSFWSLQCRNKVKEQPNVKCPLPRLSFFVTKAFGCVLDLRKRNKNDIQLCNITTGHHIKAPSACTSALN